MKPSTQILTRYSLGILVDIVAICADCIDPAEVEEWHSCGYKELRDINHIAIEILPDCCDICGDEDI